MTAERRGPLAGVVVLEVAGIGPGPFACMMLSDWGADVIRVDRPGHLPWFPSRSDVLNRGRRSIALDLGCARGREVFLQLVEAADVLVEGFRPGVMERLGLGPEQCQAVNPGIVYGRITGWGQQGPLAERVGHDINYLSITGALAAIGERGRKPVPPLNLVADFGGGSMFLLCGVLAALIERQQSGQGQVIDAAMVDGVTALMATQYCTRAEGLWTDERASNTLDGGLPNYDTYECADGEYVAVGPLEERFFAVLVDALVRAGLPPIDITAPAADVRAALEVAFRTRSREEWARLLADVDACVTPVKTLGEAQSDPHLLARSSIVEAHGLRQPAPAPRFSRTPGAIAGPPSLAGSCTTEILRDLGISLDEIAALLEQGVVACP